LTEVKYWMAPTGSGEDMKGLFILE